ncbi:UNVERIFIED_CONTAM: hypothetical protein FKN15_001929 [Acipenser sinensis]
MDTIMCWYEEWCLGTEAPERSHSILLQSSVNGGISWQLLDEFYFPLTTDVLFLHVPIPHAAQTNATRFRLWQPYNSGKKEEVWVIDDLIIDGNTMKTPAFLTDSFELGPREDSWLFYPGGNTGLYCPYLKGALEDDSAMVFVSNEAGEHSITTRDMDVSENTVIQFEFSRDFGATWHLLVPLCHGGSRLNSLCSTEHHPSSIYYPGTTQGWRRELVHFGKLRLCGSVRFRWYQGFYAGGTPPTTWALDNVYIGPQCEDMCSGHGACVNGTHCECDPGYSGPTCKTSSTANPDFLTEDFEGSLDTGLFVLVSGGKPSRKCSILSSGNNLFFSEEGFRMLVTTDLNLSNARFVEYWARIGSENNMTTCHRPACRKEGVLLDYSSDGGMSWTLLHEMDYQKYVAVRRDYIVLPDQAQTNTTRLRWWQPFVLTDGVAVPSLDRAQWALDNILIGGAEINPSQLVDNFDDEGVSHEESWSFYPNAVRTAGFCGNPSFHLYWPNKKLDDTHNILATRELIIQPGYTLQFKIVVGCEVESCGELHSVLLEYRKDARMDSWQQVQEECLPSSVNNVGCSPFQFHEATIYSAVNSSSWSRVTLQLPDHVSSSATQFRWIQREGSAEKQSWAVDQVYIGEACPRLCSGHGYCTSGAVCICDEGHQGDDCSISSSDLPSYIKDNFESESVTEVNWQQIQGGGIGSGCGQLSPHAHGDSLYFTGCKTRQAVTRPLDLTRASKIMFVLQIGSVAQTDSCNMDLGEPNTVDKAVLLQYSINNGITWHVIAQHQPKDFIQAQRVSYNIPLEARVKGVQLRWWQPRHNGTGHDQWALDHVEVVLTRKQNYMMNFSRQTGLRHFYSRKRRALRRHF